MQLPFTVVFEPPAWAPRARWVWFLIAALVVAAVSSLLYLVALSRQAGAAPQAAGPLAVESAPPGATVDIDGRPHGQSPLTARVAPCEHRVTLRWPGYANATYVVTCGLARSAR